MPNKKTLNRANPKANLMAESESQKRKAFVRATKKLKPGQWKTFKKFARTGKAPRNLTNATLWRLYKPGFELAEVRGKRAGRKSRAQLSQVEKIEIKKQARDLVQIVYPNLETEEKTKIASRLFLNTGLVERCHVAEVIGSKNKTIAFTRGRMYLDALDPKNMDKARATERKTGKSVPGIRGFHNGKMVVDSNWMRDAYGKTTPIHEMAHNMLGSDEHKAYLVNFYYSLRRGFLDPRGLRIVVPKKYEAAAEQAIKLFNKIKRQGRGKTEEELRGILNPLIPITL